MYKIEDIINKIHCADCLQFMKDIPDNSIDIIFTSPPYWSLRDYQIEPLIWGGDKNCEHQWDKIIDIKHSGTTKIEWAKDMSRGMEKENWIVESDFCLKCSAWRGQLGLEPHPNLYLDHLIEIFDEVKRILKKTGSCYVNLGDTYFGNIIGSNRDKNAVGGGVKKLLELKKQGKIKRSIEKSKWLQPKQLLGIPERFMIRMQDKGWILRNKNIWHKPNPMPSSCRDRRNTTYEYVYHFVKNRHYYFDLDAIREPHNEESIRKYICDMKLGREKTTSKYYKTGMDAGKRMGTNPNLLNTGKNPGDVLILSTEPFSEAHFATFPQKLVEPFIKASCPQWICKKCGKIRKRISEYEYHIQGKVNKLTEKNDISGMSNTQLERKLGRASIINVKTIGFTSCNCNTEFDAGIVCDIFAGAGTVALVAKKLGRNYIGIEAKQEYIDMAEKRLKLAEIGINKVSNKEYKVLLKQVEMDL